MTSELQVHAATEAQSYSSKLCLSLASCLVYLTLTAVPTRKDLPGPTINGQWLVPACTCPKAYVLNDSPNISVYNLEVPCNALLFFCLLVCLEGVVFALYQGISRGNFLPCFSSVSDYRCEFSQTTSSHFLVCA